MWPSARSKLGQWRSWAGLACFYLAAFYLPQSSLSVWQEWSIQDSICGCLVGSEQRSELTFTVQQCPEHACLPCDMKQDMEGDVLMTQRTWVAISCSTEPHRRAKPFRSTTPRDSQGPRKIVLSPLLNPQLTQPYQSPPYDLLPWNLSSTGFSSKLMQNKKWGCSKADYHVCWLFSLGTFLEALNECESVCVWSSFHPSCGSLCSFQSFPQWVSS